MVSYLEMTHFEERKLKGFHESRPDLGLFAQACEVPRLLGSGKKLQQYTSVSPWLSLEQTLQWMLGGEPA